MPTTTATDRLIAKAVGDSAVLAVLMFGSLARGEQGPASDVDICLVLQPGVPKEAMTEKRLEYLGEFNLDIHVFQQLPLYIRSRVFKEGCVLLSKDDEPLYELACRTVREFEDFKPIYQTYLDTMLHAKS